MYLLDRSLKSGSFLKSVVLPISGSGHRKLPQRTFGYVRPFAKSFGGAPNETLVEWGRKLSSTFAETSLKLRILFVLSRFVLFGCDWA